MPFHKATLLFDTIDEARAHFIRQGYVTLNDSEVNTVTMSKVIDGDEVGRVLIRQAAPFTVVAEILELVP